jgi:hypothetical protein
MTRTGSAWALVASSVALFAMKADAQCRPPANSHEARLLAFYEAPIAFSMSSAPEQLRPGAVRIGAEMIPVPSPNPALQHPDYCYANTTNNTRVAPVFGRPRLTVGLPARFAAEVSYLPNVTVSAAQASLVSVALTHADALPFSRKRLSFAVRVDATAGQVRAAITCPQRSLQTSDENIPCYGTQPSRDTFHPNSVGLETAIAMRVVGDGVTLYAGGGARLLRPHFRAGFTDALGNVDHTTVDVDLLRGTAFTGVTARLRDRLFLSTQLYVVPADVATLRFGAQYTLR